MRLQNQKSLMPFALILCVAMLLVAGCRTSPLYNVNNAPVAGSKSSAHLSTDKVEKAIIVAGAGLGWKIYKASEGELEGVLNIRRHQAVVSIPYDDSTYSIVYKSSSNLRYDGTRIHSNYNGWIHNLDHAIQVQLGLALSK